MKTFYENPKMDIVEFEVEDIITTSVGVDPEENFSDYLQPSDNWGGGGIF